MIKHPLLMACLGVTAISAMAQPNLLPDLNSGVLPADGDPICTLPMQTPPINTCGRPEGEQAADFTLFDINGAVFNLEDALLQGKPVLMISSSYTCPVFRNKVGTINQLVADHGSQLTIAIVYTPEAHPDVDISPYFGAVNTGQQNINAGILYQQPTTYGERKAVVQDMLADLQIDAPVYLDGPCNEWWDFYGPQPNNAYLIDTNGTIHTHHDWFEKLPEDIDCDIEDLLALPPTGDCGGGSYGGHFNVEWVSNDTVYGLGGTTLTAHLKLFNTSPTEDVLVRVVKLENDLPPGWGSSLCLDACYLPDVDTAIVPIAAGDTMHFYYYFYSTPGAAIGYTRLGMRNEEDLSNGFTRQVWGVVEGGVGLVEEAVMPRALIVPNPARDRITVLGASRTDGFVIMDMTGRPLMRSIGPDILLEGLPSGSYLVMPLSPGAPANPMRLVKN